MHNDNSQEGVGISSSTDFENAKEDDRHRLILSKQKRKSFTTENIKITYVNADDILACSPIII